MFRKTLTILSLIGLLLSVGLWVCAYFSIAYKQSDTSAHLIQGGLSLQYLTPYARQSSGSGWGKPVIFCGRFQGLRTDWLPAVDANSKNDRLIMLSIFLPMWIPTLLFGIAGTMLIKGHRRRKRKKLGLCMKCGYDLRASKNLCPECGEEMENGT